MPLSLNGSGGITYPDGSVNTTRSVSTAGDTMTGPLILNMSAADSGQHLSINSGTAAMLQLKQKPGGGDHAYIEYYPRGASSVRGAYVGFPTAGGTHFQIGNEQGGDLVLSTGSEIVLVPGKLRFPATQTGSSNANTLDDYEEGTWTPSVPGHSMSIVGGDPTYTKVGRMVFAYCYINVTTAGGSTNWIVSGLPFNCQQAYGPVLHYYGVNANQLGAATYVEAGTASAYITRSIPAGASGHMFMFMYHTGT